LVFDLDEDLPEFMADSDRLRQVLNNLIINAKDALAQTLHPEIRLSTLRVREKDGIHIRVTVADNGPGVPKDVMDRLFEPYVSTKEKGTGLGLAIVKRIVEEHGGLLWAENRAGGGACITIQIPQVMRRDHVTDPATGINRGATAEEKIA
jgi:nitrogen fixation/metabolism regulation signal transduction histidine kinase